MSAFSGQITKNTAQKTKKTPGPPSPTTPRFHRKRGLFLFAAKGVRAAGLTQ
jgi:hypothetical protein